MNENTTAQIIHNASSLEQLKTMLIESIEQDESLPSEKFKNKYLGRKKGIITALFTDIAVIAEQFHSEKKEVGEILNEVKKKAEEKTETKGKVGSLQYTFDPTFDKYRIPLGKLNPISRENILIEDIFMRMGFDLIDDTLIDTDFNVFESLNIPLNHPARDMWDTFWTTKGDVLRTQTTAFQNHLLREAKAASSFPVRAIQVGLCFRNEATDARHEHTFYQVDALYVEKEKKVSVVDLITTLRSFFSSYFGKEMNIRIQPGYFPFVEPGFEFAISCPFCNMEGCGVCSKSGWVEIGGCGMVHPNVLKAAGLNPGEYSGFAFGFGPDRMAILKLDINDIRLFRSGDIRFLQNT